MKHKQPRRLFWERYIQEGTNRHRPAVSALRKIVRNKKRIKQSMEGEITQQDFIKIDRLIKAMSVNNSKFWRQLMDNEANAYLNAVAMIETVIENKKEVTAEIAQMPTQEQMEEWKELIQTMRTEIKEAAWISSRTKKTFKRALCDVMQNGISEETKPALRQGQAKRSKQKRETITLF